jgi:hypothetical protein
MQWSGLGPPATGFFLANALIADSTFWIRVLAPTSSSLPLSQSLSRSKLLLDAAEVVVQRSSWFIATLTDELIGVFSLTSFLPTKSVHISCVLLKIGKLLTPVLNDSNIGASGHRA